MSIISEDPSKTTSSQILVSTRKQEDTKDIEAQNVIVVDEVIPTQAIAVPQELHPQVINRVIYIRETPSHHSSLSQTGVSTDPREYLLPCAILGACFSFIPIVGWVSCIINSDAPTHTLRYHLASFACFVSTIIFIFNIVFWTTYQH